MRDITQASCDDYYLPQQDSSWTQWLCVSLKRCRSVSESFIVTIHRFSSLPITGVLTLVRCYTWQTLELCSICQLHALRSR